MAVDEAMEDEFGTMAAWTHEAVVGLGPEHAMPAACRGSGRPSGLEWLLTRLGPAAGSPLLDVGAGLGGPAAFAREQTDVRPVCVDPMGQASAAAAALFRLPALVGEAARLPFASGSSPSPGHSAPCARLRRRRSGSPSCDAFSTRPGDSDSSSSCPRGSRSGCLWATRSRPERTSPGCWPRPASCGRRGLGDDLAEADARGES